MNIDRINELLDELMKEGYNADTYVRSPNEVEDDYAILRIVSKGHGMNTHVYLNGIELNHVTNINFTVTPDGFNQAIIQMTNIDFELEDVLNVSKEKEYLEAHRE